MNIRPIKRGMAVAVLAFSVSVVSFFDNPAEVYGETPSQEERIEMLEKRLDGITRELEQMRATVPDRDRDRLSSIEAKLDILAQEIESLKSPAMVADAPREGSGGTSGAGSLMEIFGHAPGASKVYSIGKGLSIGGYGEMNAQIREDDDNTIDALRAVLYVGYRFTDRIVFNSEYEFEHATTSDNLDGREGSVSVEFANIDFLLHEHFNLRVGLNLIPVGIINEVHEPTTFFGTLRPDIESQVIPTTWRAGGVGVFGELVEGLEYRAYVVSALDSRGFSAGNIRSARSKGNRARLNDIAFVTRLEYDVMPGLTLGSSFYIGNTGQNEKVAGETIDGTFTLFEADYRFKWRGLESRALFVYTWLDDAGLINANNELLGDDSVGEEMYGFYVEAGYDVLPHIIDTGHYLAPFVRYEQYDTQRKVPAGFMSDPANDRKTITYGLSYKPIPNVVLKLDFQDRRNEARTARDQFNLGVGWVF